MSNITDLAEMAKLRKLLEDVHTESEQQIHILRQKHQTAMMELQVKKLVKGLG